MFSASRVRLSRLLTLSNQNSPQKPYIIGSFGPKKPNNMSPLSVWVVRDEELGNAYPLKSYSPKLLALSGSLSRFAPSTYT